VPYMCDPGHCGDLLHAQEELDDMVARVHRAGGQVAVHANGDAAVQATITALARAQGSDGRRARHRIEHCQVTQPADLDAIVAGELGVSFFANHVYYWGDRHRDRFIGPARAGRLDPLASAQRQGITFGLHSDTPVVPVPPLEGIWCAVERMTRNGQRLGDEQRVDVRTALGGYTSQAAHLGFEEEEKGTLAAGKVADVAVLSHDPLVEDPSKLRDIEVEATIVGGEVVWSRAPRTSPPDANTA
jgi:predicted amidohydrolase YtcJ